MFVMLRVKKDGNTTSKDSCVERERKASVSCLSCPSPKREETIVVVVVVVKSQVQASSLSKLVEL